MQVFCPSAKVTGDEAQGGCDHYVTSIAFGMGQLTLSSENDARNIQSVARLGLVYLSSSGAIGEDRGYMLRKG